jgi:hypothetical protein
LWWNRIMARHTNPRPASRVTTRPAPRAIARRWAKEALTAPHPLPHLDRLAAGSAWCAELYRLIVWAGPKTAADVITELDRLTDSGDPGAQVVAHCLDAFTAPSPEPTQVTAWRDAENYCLTFGLLYDDTDPPHQFEAIVSKTPAGLSIDHIGGTTWPDIAPPDDATIEEVTWGVARATLIMAYEAMDARRAWTANDKVLAYRHLLAWRLGGIP